MRGTAIELPRTPAMRARDAPDGCCRRQGRRLAALLPPRGGTEWRRRAFLMIAGPSGCRECH
ncbi:hypothetical protein C9E82_09230 [Paracoccus siganidrum]|uniref:Uncharacterized protein n=1 Tax=Paracoccus siganidrum TaxID=1276757 RepID=A0A419A5S0_9RHOB|nr:hypothetical protein D3P05_13370 [Paracoccus siganidrum]RMC36738.1 hypothetical protein C9E82_09230 [Paracoccus siganidrum]